MEKRRQVFLGKLASTTARPNERIANVTSNLIPRREVTSLVVH